MKRVTLLDLGAPKEALGYATIKGGNSAARRAAERKAIANIKQWLENINNNYNLDLEIVDTSYGYPNGDPYGGLRCYRNGEEICYYTIHVSANHVYIKRNFKNLLSLIKQKIQKV
jgi:arabinogalactan endo-1,4-beta-galactosidase